MKKYILIFLICLLPSAVFGANGTTIGTLTLLPTFENIGVTCTYTGDDNSNMTAVVEYKTTAGSTWTTAHTPYIDRRSVVAAGGSTTTNPRQYEVRTSIFELTRATAYDVRVTFTDSDGVTGTNPTSTSTTTWSHDTRTYSGTTRTVCSGGTCDFTTITDAITGSSANDIIQVKAGNYGGFTLSKSGIKIEAFDDANMPAITSVTVLSGDDNELDHLNFSTGYIEASGGGTYNVIRYCTFTQTRAAGGAIALMGAPLTGLLVEYNTFTMTGMSQGSESSTAIYSRVSLATTGSYVIRYNTFYDCWDAFGGLGNQSLYGGPGESSDFYGNTVYRSDDDSFETEGADINLRIYNNDFYPYGGSPANDTIGVAMCSIGPAFIWNNVSYYQVGSGDKYIFKTGNGPSTGPKYIYYNTFVKFGTGISLAGGGSDDNITSYCNIWSKNGSTYYIYDRVGDTTIQSDYNLYYNPGSVFTNLDDETDKSLADWRTYTAASNIYGQQDTNTFTGTLGFVSEGTDFSLTVSSSAINACGVTIYGITKDKAGNTRSAPYDIGAYEYTTGTTPPQATGCTISGGTFQ